jgi:hypothetical protein
MANDLSMLVGVFEIILRQVPRACHWPTAVVAAINSLLSAENAPLRAQGNRASVNTPAILFPRQ